MGVDCYYSLWSSHMYSSPDDAMHKTQERMDGGQEETGEDCLIELGQASGAQGGVFGVPEAGFGLRFP
jgi:hypothetical protein